MTDWNDAFDNVSHIPNAASYPEIWLARAAQYREKANFAELDISYGEHPRETLDLFWPEGKPKGLAVFVHGGYWIRLDKSFWSDLAEGARKNGWVVAIPSYVLTPDVRIRQITQQIGVAITLAAERVAGPILLSGHSAGGHLVSRMICKDSPLKDIVSDRIGHVLSISGVHDLQNLRKTKMNETLQLSEREAKAESVYLLEPQEGAELTAWVGGNERPEFIRQAKLLASVWDEAGAKTRTIEDEGKHHFTVVDGLAEVDSAITQAFIGSSL